MIILFVVLISIPIYCFAKMHQLERFGAYMDKEIEALFASGDWRSKDIDIHFSYLNCRRSMLWNYNFADMIVYA